MAEMSALYAVGARQEFVSNIRSGLERPTAAAFVLSCDGWPTNGAKLSRTLAVAAYHAVGRGVWMSLGDGEIAAAICLLLAWGPAPTASRGHRYLVRDPTGAGGIGLSHPYFRVRDVGPISFDCRKITVLLANVVAPPAGPSAPRFFRKCCEGGALTDIRDAYDPCARVAASLTAAALSAGEISGAMA